MQAIETPAAATTPSAALPEVVPSAPSQAATEQTRERLDGDGDDLSGLEGLHAEIPSSPDEVEDFITKLISNSPGEIDTPALCAEMRQLALTIREYGPLDEAAAVFELADEVEEEVVWSEEAWTAAEAKGFGAPLREPDLDDDDERWATEMQLHQLRCKTGAPECRVCRSLELPRE